MADMNIAITITGYDAASGPIGSVSRAIGGLATTQNEATQSSGNLATALMKVATTAAAIDLSRIVSGGFKEAFNALSDTVLGFNARLEQSQIAWGTFLNSAQAGKKMISDLQSFAATTPFRFSGLDQAARDMVAMGFAGDKILYMMKDIAAAASATGRGQEGFDRLSYTLSEMQALGHVDTRLMRQLALDGIPSWEMLSESMHKSTTELRAMARASNIPASQFFTAFHDFVAQNWGDMLAAQAQTFSGSLTTIYDNLQIAGAHGFDPFFERITRVTSAFGQFTRTAQFTEFSNTVNSGLESILSTLDRVNPKILEAGVTIVAIRTGIPIVLGLAGAFTALQDAVAGSTIIQGIAAIGTEAGIMEGITAGSVLGLVPPFVLVTAAVAAFAIAYENNFMDVQTTTNNVVRNVREDLLIWSTELNNVRIALSNIDLTKLQVNTGVPESLNSAEKALSTWDTITSALDPRKIDLSGIVLPQVSMPTIYTGIPEQIDKVKNAAVQAAPWLTGLRAQLEINTSNTGISLFGYHDVDNFINGLRALNTITHDVGVQAGVLKEEMTFDNPTAAEKKISELNRLGVNAAIAAQQYDDLATAEQNALINALGGAGLDRALVLSEDPVVGAVNAQLDAMSEKMLKEKDAATLASAANSAFRGSVESTIPGLAAFDQTTERISRQMSAISLSIEQKKLTRMELRPQVRPQQQLNVLQEEMKIRGLERDVTFGSAIKEHEAPGSGSLRQSTADGTIALRDQERALQDLTHALSDYETQVQNLANWQTNVLPNLESFAANLASTYLLFNATYGSTFQSILDKFGPKAALADVTAHNQTNALLGQYAKIAAAANAGDFGDTGNPVLDNARRIALTGPNPTGKEAVNPYRNPKIGSNIPGYADGGSWEVGGSGGEDSQLVQFMASPDERVTVHTPEQQTLVSPMLSDDYLSPATSQPSIFSQVWGWAQNNILNPLGSQIQQNFADASQSTDLFSVARAAAGTSDAAAARQAYINSPGFQNQSSGLLPVAGLENEALAGTRPLLGRFASWAGDTLRQYGAPEALKSVSDLASRFISDDIGGIYNIFSRNAEDHPGHLVSVETGAQVKNRLRQVFQDVPGADILRNFIPENYALAGNYRNGPIDVYNVLNGLVRDTIGENPKLPLAGPRVRGAAWHMGNVLGTSSDTRALDNFHMNAFNDALWNVAKERPEVIAHEFGHTLQSGIQSMAQIGPMDILRELSPELEDPNHPVNAMLQARRGQTYNIGLNPSEGISQILELVHTPNGDIDPQIINRAYMRLLYRLRGIETADPGTARSLQINPGGTDWTPLSQLWRRVQPTFKDAIPAIPMSIKRFIENDPGKLPGYASGGSWMVGGYGGTDSQFVGFNATPNERVTVETPAQQGRGQGIVFNSPMIGEVHVHDEADENRLMGKLNDLLVGLTISSGRSQGKAQYQLGGAR